MSEIFVSYARADSGAASKIIARLEAEGNDIWVDRDDISGGQLWRESIVKAISECSVFVILISTRSVSSNNVRKEMDLADKKGKPILPVMLEQSDIPANMEYQLAGIQWIDFHTNFNRGLEQLSELLRRQRHGDLEVKFVSRLEHVIAAEQSIPEGIKAQRFRVYSNFTRSIWSKPPGIRFRYQQMYTLSHLNEIGVTVAQLKAALKQLQYYVGVIDESFDPALAAAIVRFQHDSGLDPDGIAGTLTYAKIAQRL